MIVQKGCSNFLNRHYCCRRGICTWISSSSRRETRLYFLSMKFQTEIGLRYEQFKWKLSSSGGQQQQLPHWTNYKYISQLIVTAIISNTEVSCTSYKETDKEEVHPYSNLQYGSPLYQVQREKRIGSLQQSPISKSLVPARERERERGSSLKQSPIRKSLVPAPKRETHTHLESICQLPMYPISTIPSVCEKDREKEGERERERENGERQLAHTRRFLRDTRREKKDN